MKLNALMSSVFLVSVMNMNLCFGQKNQKPNVVFILADDLGWKDLGCYGNPFNETPNLDQLAHNGILFTEAYAASPVCSPTRASIMTGKHPARLQLTNFIAGNRTDSLSPVLPANWKPFLEPGETTIAELLKGKGYTTGMIGKWHLGRKDEHAPWNRGFDHSRMIGKNGLDYYNYSIFMDSFENEFIDHDMEYLTDKLTEYGVEFIQKNAKKPFFLYLSYSAPHVMIVPRADKLAKYLRKHGKYNGEFDANYAAMVESVDDGVGILVQTLEDHGLLENTLIVFTSDNGGLGIEELGPRPTSNHPLRKWKGHVYEGGIRVPAIVSWKGKVPKETVSDNYYSSIDYLPTFCELAGIKQLPADVDGSSVLSLFLSPKKAIHPQRPVFWHYPHFSNQMGRPSGAVRLGDYKLLEFYETGRLELYNLKDDIGEQADLSQKLKQKTVELHRLLSDWRTEADAQMPLPNPDYHQSK